MNTAELREEDFLCQLATGTIFHKPFMPLLELLFCKLGLLQQLTGHVIRHFRLFVPHDEEGIEVDIYLSILSKTFI